MPLRKQPKCEVMLPQPARARRRRARPTCGARNRGPPTDWAGIVQTHDDRTVFHVLPDEFPVIDIDSLRRDPMWRCGRLGFGAGLR